HERLSELEPPPEAPVALAHETLAPGGPARVQGGSAAERSEGTLDARGSSRSPPPARALTLQRASPLGEPSGWGTCLAGRSGTDREAVRGLARPARQVPQPDTPRPQPNRCGSGCCSGAAAPQAPVKTSVQEY